jgi:hypothetical protein
MDTIAEILSQITELKSILEQVNFKIYFNPEQLSQVDGVDQLIPITTSLVANINLVSTPVVTPPITP